MTIDSHSQKLDDSKMFVILTYMVEFDKVHYPLSLNKVSFGNNQAHLIGTIQNLKKELSFYKSQGNSSMQSSSMMQGGGGGSVHSSFMGPSSNHSQFQPPGVINQILPNSSGVSGSQTLNLGNVDSQTSNQGQIFGSQLQASQTSVTPTQEDMKVLMLKIDELQGEIGRLKTQETGQKEGFKKKKGKVGLAEPRPRKLLPQPQNASLNSSSEDENDGDELEQNVNSTNNKRTKNREVELLRAEVQTLRIKVDEMSKTEKMLLRQLKEANEALELERQKRSPLNQIKKSGLSGTSKRDKRPDSPWKKGNRSRSGRIS